MSCFYREEGKTWHAGVGKRHKDVLVMEEGMTFSCWHLGFQLLCVKSTGFMEFTRRG